MSNYRRPYVNGGTYFITQVTYQRQPWLCSEIGRVAMREAIQHVRQQYPFEIDAIVLLPDHFHALLTLPVDDSNFSLRMRLIKRYVTRYYGAKLEIDLGISESRIARKERNLWQRRFWEHLIRDETDFANHCDYIHYNPVRHGLCDRPQGWAFSRIHRFVRSGIYPSNWSNEIDLNDPIEDL
ncbi:REP-associated tyrosine transposase [Chamaesiphon sp. OTE_20_metabat_361]|uniref:REP-associated tyrosine transposase n=1 Tax=Chamaesiphon sp. OTE_20_metabat_361 TaxID=2964689 RepID=UPI00286D6099|nr:transposase [Chamaesiphon sp. OTE_20_metabat_361]